jgi:transposase
MGISSEVRRQLGLRFTVLFPHLNERQRRLLVGQEARLLGHGGLRAVAQAAGVSETTVRAGVFELEAGEDPLPDGRVRRPGGGRKTVEDVDPKVLPALLALVEPDERGDPMSPLRWTTKSLRVLAEELTAQGHPVSAPTVGRLLREQGFSLQANVKTLEGTQHPDRDAQFRYINEQVKQHQADGQPVISVDAKKKEVLGQLPNPGRQWRPAGKPVQVEDHSFFSVGPDAEVAIPYGVYDITANTGWVNVGVDHDTSAFAVASIRRWWRARGTSDYPGASQLLITADAGGSNNCRFRLWKSELAVLAAETGLSITVCHFPPGTSKWNRIEHRLFSHITMNWRGRPLTPQFAHRLRRHEGGPHQAVGAELGQPRRVRDVRLAAGEVLDLPGVDQDHVQVLGQQVVEGLPVVRGRLDHHQRHPRGEQVIPQGEHRVRRRSPGRGLRREGPAPLRTRGADARLGVLLADVQARAAFMQHVHGLAPSLTGQPGWPFREGQGESGI